ncbi:MAG: hypothetical protein C5B45_04830 [Chlamydiae bacterium]|nr:MAG: hypothetical protein C5B45_04830 [Chlamydiota bacterium]
MSCTMHVASAVISYAKKQKRAGKSNFFPDIDSKKAISVAGQWLTHIAKTTTAKTHLKTTSIAQIN